MFEKFYLHVLSDSLRWLLYSMKPPFFFPIKLKNYLSLHLPTPKLTLCGKKMCENSTDYQWVMKTGFVFYESKLCFLEKRELPLHPLKKTSIFE